MVSHPETGSDPPIRSDGEPGSDKYCFGRFSNTFASKGKPIFLPKFGSVFSRTRNFVLKMIFYSYTA